MAITMRSEEVRKEWAKTIDTAYAERQEVVIERYGRPIVTLVNHARWEKTKKRLAELESILKAKQNELEMQADPSLIVSQEQFLTMLTQAGLATS